MSINYEFIDKKSFKTNEWSGGITKEIYISPKEATLSERNFDFRISSASVEDEQSEFSPFIGYKRFITPLSGEMKLVHEGKHTAVLSRYEIDKFSGNWKTSSYGRCRDFNLIVKEEIEADMLISSSGEEHKLSSKKIGIFSDLSDLSYQIEYETKKIAVDIPKETLFILENKDSISVNLRQASPNSQGILFWVNI